VTNRNLAARREATLRLTAPQLDDIIRALGRQDSADPDLYGYLLNKRRGLPAQASEGSTT
jgi:hypothetical protein